MESVIDRFKKRFEVDSTSGCWIWKGAFTGNGYPAFSPSKHGYDGAHRWAYRLFVGSIPEGMVVCHKCDNPSCVNPDHLFIGTHKDNQQDCSKKGRLGGRVRHGMENGMAKINDKEATQIRTLYANKNHSAVELACLFNVSRSTIFNVVNGTSFKHLPVLMRKSKPGLRRN